MVSYIQKSWIMVVTIIGKRKGSINMKNFIRNLSNYKIEYMYQELALGLGILSVIALAVLYSLSTWNVLY